MIDRDKELRICAIIAARNESQYLETLLPILAEQNIDVAIIDNESTDGSKDLFSKFTNNPIIIQETLPFRGFLSMPEVLAAKQEICKKIDHDWVIHHDPDEIMEHFQPGKSLRDAICEADELGYNAINFDEFVFIPRPGSDYFQGNYYTEVLHYYFFEPSRNRLNRAWKRVMQFRNDASGGHRLEGNSLLIAPENHILRHYIVLGEEHARRKYLNRSFDKIDLARGWHGNRLNFTHENLLLPSESNFLCELEKYNSKDFCGDKPTAKHFWQWER